MKFLSAPWRWEFICKLAGKKGCVFCDAQKKEGKESLIFHRGDKFFGILNKYPYSTGHLLIVPYSHMETPDQVSPEDSVEMWELMNRSLKVLKENFKPDGFNMGMNIGRCGGAGVAGHFHLHIVPRWAGDANFMAVTGETKVLSYELGFVYDLLEREFKQ
jgi:ATP adenylyltransferase